MDSSSQFSEHIFEVVSTVVHLEEKINKCNRIIGLIKKLSLILPRPSLLTIFKAFVRPHLDYADIIYDKPDNESLKDWVEKVQYNAALAITGTIRGTSREWISLVKNCGTYQDYGKWSGFLSTVYIRIFCHLLILPNISNTLR